VFYKNIFHSEKFFDMNKKMCKEALEIYKKFLERTESVSLFLKVAEVNFVFLSIKNILKLKLFKLIKSLLEWIKVTYQI